MTLIGRVRIGGVNLMMGEVYAPETSLTFYRKTLENE